MLFQAERFLEKDERRALLSRLVRRVFLDDWAMKLIALIITLALWLGVAGFREPITTRLSGVKLQTRVSNDYEITNSLVDDVALVITGDRRKTDLVRADNLIVSVDLTDVREGERIVQLTPETVNVELPTGVRLEEIQPNKIAIKLEKVIEREVPVKAETEGSLARLRNESEGGAGREFELYGVTVTPARVRVRGPESYVKTLDSISTEPINLEGRQNDFTAQQVSLNVVNPKVTVLDSLVDVSFRIGEKRVERLFLVPVRIETGERRVQVVLFGNPVLLANLQPEQIQIELLKNDAGDFVPEVRLPAEIEGKVEIRKKRLN